MWFHRHAWPKWSEVKHEAWKGRAVLSGIPISEAYEFSKDYQDRYCATCGKYAKRYI